MSVSRIFQADEIREHISKIKQSRRRGKRTKDNELQHEAGGPQSPELLRSNQSPSASLHTATQENSSEGEILLEQACEAMAKHLPRNHTSSSSGIYQCLFQTILNRHIRFEGPVFAMSQSIRIGDAYGAMCLAVEVLSLVISLSHIFLNISRQVCTSSSRDIAF